jgi:transcription-repair coupling factor (superfamily II helicase)
MINFLNNLIQNKASFSLNLTTSLPAEIIAQYLGTSSQISGPQLVITESPEKAQNFIETLSFWTDKKVQMLPNYDPHLFAGVQLSHRQLQQRLSWLFNALNDNENHIFVAPILGLLQKTLPPEDFMENCFEFSKGDHLPEDFFERLYQLGYLASPLVEDPGRFVNRGGIIDIYSPQMKHPVRIELFDTEIESLRIYDSSSQRTLGEIEKFLIAPAREVLLSEKKCLNVSQSLLQFNHPELHVLVNHLRKNEYYENLEYYLPLFYENAASALDYFQRPMTTWFVDELSLDTYRLKELSLYDQFYDSQRHPLTPKDLFHDYFDLKEMMPKKINVERINIIDSANDLDQKQITINTQVIKKPKVKKFNEQLNALCINLEKQDTQNHILMSVKGQSQFDRLKVIFEAKGYTCLLHEEKDFDFKFLQKQNSQKLIHFFPRKLHKSYNLTSENLSIYSLEHFLGQHFTKGNKQNNQKRAQHLSFGELKENDYIIHAVHGMAQFKGLQKMPVAGIDGEFLVLEFKDKDKLFLPIYRIHQIHKYSSERVEPALDKLGSSRFANVKTKTKTRLREMAHDLIKLYADRTQTLRPPYQIDKDDILDFFNAFPYQETEDQISAIDDIMTDLSASKPMDRLICGDVGFGKTEVAMRAAFIVASNRKQVAILAPTTVLTMQHFETFKKRFKGWPINIQVVNRLQSSSQIKKTLDETYSGEVDILIGTHRLLSQDVRFKNLSLLVIDEEQKFGVKHKEIIRKMKLNVDTLCLSATPIPRTLNMSLLKIRDLSLINTAPVDRLEVRTFICRHDKEIIKRAIETELERGGQVFFLHNRVQSIYSVAEELRQILPRTPIGVAHGQLVKKDLESVMISFFNNDLKVLVASAIVESGVDIPNANTILINQADIFGLSQLYQLRGRVGRSGRRAYCYLLTDQNKKLSDIAQERLKVIQENTALGSGLQIAHYDLELRGAGTLLGEEQSGVIDNVGYEFYMQLLEEAIQEAKGQKTGETVEPDINLKIKAFIPSTYISNIRLRLSYYRALTQIESPEDIDQLEEELKDQFGKPPEEVNNLLGLMLIRHTCVRLGVKDISTGKENLVLSFADSTPLPVEKVISLTALANKKYSITPDNRLKIRMREMTWPRILDEVSQLLKLC